MGTGTEDPLRGLVDAFVRAHDAHDFDALAGLCSDDCELVGPVASVHGRAAIRAAMPQFLDAFSDDRFTADCIVSTESTLMFEWTFSARHTGIYHGPLGDVPPTARRIVLRGVDAFDVRDSHITRYRSYFDSLDLIRQLSDGVPSSR
jgi:steroid delta-isomerase-like uncharacterized protein